MTWVLQPIVTREIGLSDGQLRGMAQRGKLRRGEHYAVIDRKTVYNLEALQSWLDSEACAQRGLESKSDTKRAANGEACISTRRRQNPISRMRLATARS